MQTRLFILLFIIAAIPASGTPVRDTTIHYTIPDSIKAISFLAEINVKAINPRKEQHTGVRTGPVSLTLESEKKEKEIVFEFPGSAPEMARGLGVKSEKGELSWNYDWTVNEVYKLLISVATDSAGNFSLYSGYAWLARESKWKLIGTCKISGQWNTIQDPAIFTTGKGISIEIGQLWLQRQSGSWKQLNGDQPNIVVNLFPHIDSSRQSAIEKENILQAIANGKTDASENIEGVFYKILNPGTGRQVTINDTVTVRYKLVVFNDGSVVEETQDNPPSFPLKRLIRGWQLVVPLVKVGGKVRVLIPSAMAYSIRTRSPRIPPNSILQFDIEVLDAKAPL